MVGKYELISTMMGVGLPWAIYAQCVADAVGNVSNAPDPASGVLAAVVVLPVVVGGYLAATVGSVALGMGGKFFGRRLDNRELTDTISE